MSIITRTGQVAYLEYCRIHAEEGINLPEWSALTHVKRLAWEAAAQKVASPQIDRQEQVQKK